MAKHCCFLPAFLDILPCYSASPFCMLLLHSVLSNPCQTKNNRSLAQTQECTRRRWPPAGLALCCRSSMHTNIGLQPMSRMEIEHSLSFLPQGRGSWLPMSNPRSKMTHISTSYSSWATSCLCHTAVSPVIWQNYMTTVVARSPAVLPRPCQPHQAESACACYCTVNKACPDVQTESELDMQASRLKAQDAMREDEGKRVEQERKLMERRVTHQVQVVPE